MPGAPNDFRVEIIKGRPQTSTGIVFQVVGNLEVQFNALTDPPPEVVDITSRIPREGFGSINRAMERDLLSFKTGDLTLTALNRDGFFDDLFALSFGATTIWSLRVYRRGDVAFWGALIGLGSITFDRKAKTVEMSVYGLTKLLDMTSAELVRRGFPDPITVTTATGGASTLTLNTTAVLVTGDVLHLTDHVNKEDVTVKQVTSATVVQLKGALAHSYAAGTVVTVNTKFRRYASLALLVSQLFRAAFIGLAELKLSKSQFRFCVPTPVNIEGLPVSTDFAAVQPVEKDGLTYHAISNTGLLGGIYYQSNPAGAWTRESATTGVNDCYIDWSRYFRQDEAGPDIVLKHFASLFGNQGSPWNKGWDYRQPAAGTKTVYFYVPASNNIQKRTTVDGFTWSGASVVATFPVAGSPAEVSAYGVEFDPVRNLLYVYKNAGATTLYTYVYDIGGATWTNLAQADDAVGQAYLGPVYVPELDAVLALRATNQNGPTFEICAFRGTVRLWKRAFPPALVKSDGAAELLHYPTHDLRSVGGSLYCPVLNDGDARLVRSDDEFVTYDMGTMQPNTSSARMFAARVLGTYTGFTYSGADAIGYFVAAPFYAGVIDYADFSGLSVAEALKKLAVLTNALFWVDDDCQGHFVARDLFDPGAVLDITSRIKERQETLLWDQTAQYVTVAGNGFEATAGDKAFAADGIELESSFLPNAAFAQALADAYHDVYSVARLHDELVLRDIDGMVFRPLDRVMPDGASRFLVYESDHSLIDDEIRVTMLEDR